MGQRHIQLGFGSSIFRTIGHWVSIVVVVLLCACSSVTPDQLSTASTEQMAPRQNAGRDYRIQPGDELEVKFFYTPELNERLFVRPDGKIALQLLTDEIDVAGLTAQELNSLLTEQYAEELREPRIAVLLRSFSGQQVYVGGEVNQQGLVAFQPGMTPLQAVFRAQGLNHRAAPKEAIVVTRNADRRPQVLRVNLEDVLLGQAPGGDFSLQPNDIVYVPASRIAKANDFVRQYIRDLLLFRGVAVSLSYDLNDNDNRETVSFPTE